MNKDIEDNKNVIQFRTYKKTKIDYGTESPENWIATGKKTNIFSNINNQKKSKTKIKKIEYKSGIY